MWSKTRESVIKLNDLQRVCVREGSEVEEGNSSTNCMKTSLFKDSFKGLKCGLGFNLGVEYLPNMYKTLSLFPGTTKTI